MAVIVSRQPQPNLGLPPTDQPSDAIATPRAVVPHAVVVAAVVSSLPTLSPVLPKPSHESDFCLSAKRKASDDDDECDDLEPLRGAKRQKADPLQTAGRVSFAFVCAPI